MTEHVDDPLVDFLGPLDGGRVPGGCEACNAYQTVTPIRAGVWNVTVHHDDNCPELARRRRTSRD